MRQAEISESGQKFDRYARAAQMLDSDKLSVRQAGIYLLRELALSDREKYGALCVDLLASFIRNRNSEGLIQAKTKKEFTELATPADVSDALLCLSKATQSLDKEINLSSTVWVDANFENGHDFNKFDFGKIYLSKTHFYNSSLDGISSTYEAEFEYLVLHQVRSRNVHYYNTKFLSVDFEDSDFSGASFSNCKFKDCVFNNCNLSGVQFYGEGSSPQLPFDPDLLASSWAWEDRPPKLLGAKFSGSLFKIGSDSKYRRAFSKKWEENRTSGKIFENLRPNEKLKI